MKKMTFKKVASATLAAMLAACSLMGCGSKPAEEKTTEEGIATETGAAQDDGTASTDGGTILWLSNLTSGPAYEAAIAYGGAVCESLGYELQVVYGDSFNDPAGNLTAIKNGMTKDVVGIIASQDGGIQNILDEYPELPIVGFNSDMASVYDENGASAAALTNEKFLGTFVDGYADGANAGHEYAQEVIANGYKKVATMIFPVYAYPQLTAADAAFRAEIAEYNKTASEPIEIVGDAKVLEFAPLEDAYFLDAQYQDLDAIVAMCALNFVYPALKTAIASGTCSADTALLSGGWEEDPDLLADFGGTLQYVNISPIENIAYSIVLLDNAIHGLSYADAPEVPARLDSVRMKIRNQEDVSIMMEKNIYGTRNAADAWVTIDEVKNCCLSVNPDATYADLHALFTSDQLLVESHK